MIPVRFGFGYDVHKLIPNRKLIIGGVHIPHEKGALGHSDADVLIHAIIDALLGALGKGDIGSHFPDTDPAFKNIDSTLLLEKVKLFLDEAHYRPGNIDATVVLQRPKISGHIPAMKQNIAHVLHMPLTDVSIKATTTEHLGAEGREEGVSAYAVCGLYTIPE